MCRHEKREEIDRALVAGTAPERTIARQYTISRDALHRHRAHIPEEVSKAHNVKNVARADDLLARVQRHLEKLDAALETAEVARDIAALAREARETARLLLEVEGRLRVAPQVAVQVNLASTPEFLALVAAVKRALLPFPQAYAAVVAVLMQTTEVGGPTPALSRASTGQETAAAAVLTAGGESGAGA